MRSLPLVIGRTLQIPVLSRGLEAGVKVTAPDHLVGSSGSQAPCEATWRPSKSHLISIRSGMVERGSLWVTEDTPPHTRNSKGFRSPGPGPGTKTKNVLLLI